MEKLIKNDAVKLTTKQLLKKIEKLYLMHIKLALHHRNLKVTKNAMDQAKRYVSLYNEVIKKKS